ncbi:hypothetical protein [Thioalkalivibrio sp. XN8]|uniref:hypothetical protein n=1 Tax=Thioalkalivibrio sp. XN8 TaxID=2712863 RepID=UPI0013EB6801|nr:hypothetical protein [Thioalkalivibrio sp. XN8]NGP53580.1 hypothetical protein [Thioalkalivibrio sp. XN8]
MAYQDSNAPPVEAQTQAPGEESTTSSWAWIWPTLLVVIIVRLFGVVGGLVALGCYYALQPKLGTFGAVVISGVAGMGAAIGILAMIR